MKNRCEEILAEESEKNGWSIEKQLEIMCLWAEEIVQWRNDNDHWHFRSFLEEITSDGALKEKQVY